MAKRHNTKAIAQLERLVGCEWAWVLLLMPADGSVALGDLEARVEDCRRRNVRRTKVSYEDCVQRVSSVLRELRFTRRQSCLSAVFACLSSRSDSDRVAQVLRACEGASGGTIEEERNANSGRLIEAKT